MTIVLDMPAEIAQHLEEEWGHLPRKALESIAVEAYRAGVLSQGGVGRMLGMNFWETESFLKEHEAYLHYDADDLRRDEAALDRLLQP